MVWNTCRVPDVVASGAPSCLREHVLCPRGRQSLIAYWLDFSYQYILRMERDGDIALIRQNLGRRIRKLRKSLGMSQYVFSKMAGINRTYLIDVEKGRRNVSVDNLIRISSGLDVKMSVLFEDVDTISYVEERYEGTIPIDPPVA